MMGRVACVFAVLLMGPLHLIIASDDPKKTEPPIDGVGRVSLGEFVEVDEKGIPQPVLPDVPKLLIKIDEVTPNIVVLSGINGWVTFASYDESKKEYRGFFEWKQFGPLRSPGGKWADLYEVRLIKQANGDILMTGKSKTNEFVIRATPHKP
jgi:hypothetical protein